MFQIVVGTEINISAFIFCDMQKVLVVWQNYLNFWNVIDSLYPDDIKTFTFWLFLMFYICSRSTG